MSRVSDESRLDSLRREVKPLELRGWNAQGEWVLKGQLGDVTHIVVRKKVLTVAIDEFRQAHGKMIASGLLPKS